MSRTPKLATLAKGGAAVLAAAASVGGLAVHAAHADPKFVDAYVAVGSDTTQDVMNAMAGFNNGINYTPIQSSAASGRKQIISFDATPNPGCISTKLGGPTFNRPNGSGQGRRALSSTINGTANATFSNGAACAGATNISGQVDIARSSGGPSGTGTDLTYIPFGRDAVSFGYVSNGGTAESVLTSSELTTLFTNGTLAKGDQTLTSCLPQSGSGTRSFWVSAVQVSDSTANTAASANNCILQENDGAALTNALAGRPANTQLVIPFSAANFISQSNGVATASLGSVQLGEIDSLGHPVTGTAPNTSASTTFYSSTRYGRDVYNVFQASRVPSGVGGDAGLKSLFVGSSSAMCSTAAQTTVNKFGFLSIAGCGAVTLKGPLT